MNETHQTLTWAFASLLALLATAQVFCRRAFVRRYLKLLGVAPKAGGETGLLFAYRILRFSGVTIEHPIAERIGGDYYDHTPKVIGLTGTNARSTSIGALAIVAHEVCHAKQWARWSDGKCRPLSVALNSIQASKAASVLLLVAPFAVLASGGAVLQSTWFLGALAFAAAALLTHHIARLVVEVQASEEAARTLRHYLVWSESEIDAARSLYRRMALVYAVSFFRVP